MQGVKYQSIILIITFVLVFSGCYVTEKSIAIAYLRRYKSDSLEIEIPYIIKGRGSIHNFTFEKYKDSSAHWIYISKHQRRITADSLLLVYTKGYNPQSNLKGEINIHDSVLTVNFKIPRFNNKSAIKRWTNYEFNGIYKIRSITN